MKAWILHDIGKITYEETGLPQLSKTEVLIKVKASGICGSDIQRIYENGAHKMPLILGHEFSGQIVEVGDPANTTFIGKRVGVFPLIPCRTCNSCKNGKYEMCTNYSYLGSRINGAYAEYVAVPLWNVIELPDDVSYEEAAMLEPMAVAVHAMRRVTVSREDTVLIWGLGTIGQLLTMLLLEKGIEKLFVIGNKEFQKKTALLMGVKENHYCDSRVEDVQQFIFSNTQEQGAGVVFECIGKNETIHRAIHMAAPEGRICMVGNPYTDIEIDKNTYWKILRKQLKITGTWNSSFSGNGFNDKNEDDWSYALKVIGQKRVDPACLITHRIPLSDLNKGFQIMKAKSEDYIKIMILN